MTIGTITLLTVLFFGGIQEYSFLEKLENGTKQFVVDKERSNVILSDLKAMKKEINAFHKERKAKLKEFYSMNLDRKLMSDDMELFFEERMKERLIFQKNFTERRLAITSMIKPDEWNEIISFSSESSDKTTIAEQTDVMAKVIGTVKKSIKEPGRQVQAIALAENFQTRFNDFIKQTNSISSLEYGLLNNQNASATEIQKLAIEANLIRETAYKAFVDLHFDMLEITEEMEWQKIMTQINNVIK